MGEVHLRRDAWLGRDVAVKSLGKDRRSIGAARARFLREARVQGQLEHPAIVPVYDVGVDEEGQEYFTMKRVVGRTLRDVLAAGDLSRGRLLTIFRQVCLAIDYAHSRGVAHRDLKPANIMLGDFGEVYVLDWGLAKVLGMAPIVDSGVGAVGETQSGQMLGTPGYLAPEQIANAGDADDRADIYSLGAMLFEILAGEPLHRGATVAKLVESTRQASGCRPSARAPDRDVPADLDVLCERATERDPAARGIDARELAEAVDRFLEGDRDLATRRAGAAHHAERASIAEGEALADGKEAHLARARALGEAGRALALDPDHLAGADTLLRLISQPPASLPEEVKSELARADLHAMRLRNRNGLVLFLIFLVSMFALPGWGEHNWTRLSCIILPLVGALGITTWVFFSRALSVERFERCTDWVVGAGLLAVAGLSVLTTSMVLVPVLALAFAMGGAGAARSRRRRALYMAMGLAAFAIPFSLEWAHLAPSLLPGIQPASGGALIPLTAMGLPLHAFRIVVPISIILSLLAPSIMLFPVLDAASSLRTQSFLHAWHLQKLAAGAPVALAQASEVTASRAAGGA